MSKVIKVLGLILIILCISGCSEREKFAKEIEDLGYKCDNKYIHCTNTTKDEKSGNGATQKVSTIHILDFEEHFFQLDYTLDASNINTGYSYFFHYSGSYDYKNNSCYATENSSTGMFGYDTSTQMLDDFTSGNTKSYYCDGYNNADITQKCIDLLEYCDRARGMFNSLLGDYSIEDITVKD